MAKPNKRKRRVIILLLLVVVIVGGYFAVDRFAKGHGFDSGWAFMTGTASNYMASENPDISIELKIDEAEFAKLEKVREEALQRGVIIQPEDPYVQCELFYNGEKIKGKIRLKGKMTDHVEGSKWSFRVKTRKGDALLGMKRFSLQHPGTRNYVYEWIYHQMSKDEDLIALRYHFVNLTVNGDDLGVYALEEHFGQEIPENNNRVEGPVFRFNPNLYWYFRVHELQGLELIDEYTKFQSSYVDPFNESKMMKDSALAQQFGNALAMIESFRRGEIKASAIFDVEKMARRYAILDLIGGQHSADWSDVKFYYNPDNAKVEPISYESFSGRSITKLLGHYRFLEPKEYNWNFHNLLFSDEDFFRAYIKNLKRVSAQGYLEDFFSKHDSDIQHHIAVLHSEFAYKEFDTKTYYGNAELIRGNLDVPQFFHAYLKSASGDTLELQLGSVEALPAEITGLVINDSIYQSYEKPLVVPAKFVLNYVDYKTYRLIIPGLSQLAKIKSIKIENQLLGGDEPLTTEVFLYEHPEENILADNYLSAEPNANTFDFIIVDDQTKIIGVSPGTHTIDRNLVIPEGYTFRIGAGIELILNSNALIVSRSPMTLMGTDEMPIKIRSSDSTGQGIVCVDAGKSIFEHVQFSNLSRPHQGTFGHKGALNFYRSNVSFSNCDFYDITANKAIHCTNSQIVITGCAFANLSGDAIQVNFGNANIINSRFTNIGDKAIMLAGGSHQVHDISFMNIVDVALLAKEHSRVQSYNMNFSEVGTAVEAFNDGQVTLEASKINGAKFGWVAHKKGDVFGPSSITIKNVDVQNVEVPIKQDKSCTIVVDGVKQAATPKVEK